jgi:hypothetical protein
VAAEVVNPAKGTVLKYGVSSVYTPIAQITKLSGVKQKVKTRDTSYLTSTATSLAAAIPDISDGCSGDLLLDPKGTTHAAMQALIASPPLNPSQWEIVFNDVTNGPSTATFVGVLTEWSVGDLVVDGNLVGSFAIAGSGQVTWS